MRNYFLVLALLPIVIHFPAKGLMGQTDSTLSQRISAAANIRSIDPNKSLRLLEGIIQDALAVQDSTRAVFALVEESVSYGHQANYKEAYDRLWKALLLADKANLKGASANIYIAIGRYYSFYKRREKALGYFQRSLEINQTRIAAGEVQAGVLADNYYAFASTFRELDDPVNAQRYLDSCREFFHPEVSNINQTYLVFEEGYVLSQMGKYEEALTAFRSIIPWFEQNNVGYKTLVYTYMGDVLSRLGRLKESEEAYRKALAISKGTNSHRDFSPLVHQKLSDLYLLRGQYRQAYESLRTFNELDNQFFDSRSESNRPLLEIQDAFRQEKAKQEANRQQARLERLERDKQLNYLKSTVLVIFIALLLLLGFLYFKYVRTKHKSEKALIRKERELEVQQANEILRLKNKELAATTLKLIEKDEFIANIQERLSQKKGDLDAREVNAIVRSIKSNVGNDQHWREFEARFISVNKDFYTNLKQRFPKLTQGDLRLCALIKLNFSSKDVAKLMGISVESVHTTRYRLRKKLGLERKDNLVEFIAEA